MFVSVSLQGWCAVSAVVAAAVWVACIWSHAAEFIEQYTSHSGTHIGWPMRFWNKWKIFTVFAIFRLFVIILFFDAFSRGAHTIRLSSTKITKFINICVWLFLCWWPYRIRIHGVQTITPFCHAMCIYRWIEITRNKKHFFTIHIQLTVWWLKWSKCVHTAIHTSKPILYKCRTYTSREWTYALTNGIRDLSANCVLVYYSWVHEHTVCQNVTIVCVCQM